MQRSAKPRSARRVLATVTSGSAARDAPARPSVAGRDCSAAASRRWAHRRPPVRGAPTRRGLAPRPPPATAAPSTSGARAAAARLRRAPPDAPLARLPRARAERVGVVLAAPVAVVDHLRLVGCLQRAALDAHFGAAPGGALPKSASVPRKAIGAAAHTHRVGAVVPPGAWRARRRRRARRGAPAGAVGTAGHRRRRGARVKAAPTQTRGGSPAPSRRPRRPVAEVAVERRFDEETVCTFVRTCGCAHVRMCVCAYVRMCVRAYVRTCVCAYTLSRRRRRRQG